MVTAWGLELAERGWIPDCSMRWAIRRLLTQRRSQLAGQSGLGEGVVEQMRGGPLAIAAERANEQHYELPPAFFEAVLGQHLKYSCCHWSAGTTTLDEAERAALELVVGRAEISDGMRVLDLGCGWGSLSLWIAERFPNCEVTAVSNSALQGDFIRRRARARGLRKVDVLSADMNHLHLEATWDRVVSIEMFEHMRNYSLLLQRIAGWMTPEGKLFVHHFCHRSTPYLFEDAGPGDWMARHFFTGGLMPSANLLDAFAGPVRLERRWTVGGGHYQRTALAWLENMDRQPKEILDLLRPAYGTDAERWQRRWRLFFLACAELFGSEAGRAWFVSHSLWARGEAER